jgi:hypothetical protein
VTVVGPVIVVVHAPVPAHAVPPAPTVHPMKSESASAEAVSESCSPCAIIAVQAPGQLMPAAGATTMPAPEPPTSTVTGYLTRSNVAVTVTASSIVTTQVGAVPAQPPPLQPASSAPSPGVAVSVTVLPTRKSALQASPHAMPPGLDDTVPVAVPLRATVRVAEPGGGCPSGPTKTAGSIVQAAESSAEDRPRIARSPSPGRIERGDAIKPFRPGYASQHPSQKRPSRPTPDRYPRGIDGEDEAPPPPLPPR